jgi:hypothetical protein
MIGRKSTYVALLLLGICCVAASFLFPGENVKILSGILIGVGSGLVGLSLANLWMRHYMDKHPERERQDHIDYYDERSILIRQRAKAKAGDITQWLIMAFAFVTILISAPLWITLVVVAIFVFYTVIGFYYMGRYQKEM